MWLWSMHTDSRYGQATQKSDPEEQQFAFSDRKYAGQRLQPSGTGSIYTLFNMLSNPRHNTRPLPLGAGHVEVTVTVVSALVSLRLPAPERPWPVPLKKSGGVRDKIHNQLTERRWRL